MLYIRIHFIVIFHYYYYVSDYVTDLKLEFRNDEVVMIAILSCFDLKFDLLRGLISSATVLLSGTRQVLRHNLVENQLCYPSGTQQDLRHMKVAVD